MISLQLSSLFADELLEESTLNSYRDQHIAIAQYKYFKINQ